MERTKDQDCAMPECPCSHKGKGDKEEEQQLQREKKERRNNWRGKASAQV